MEAVKWYKRFLVEFSESLKNLPLLLCQIVSHVNRSFIKCLNKPDSYTKITGFLLLQTLGNVITNPDVYGLVKGHRKKLAVPNYYLPLLLEILSHMNNNTLMKVNAEGAKIYNEFIVKNRDIWNEIVSHISNKQVTRREYNAHNDQQLQSMITVRSREYYRLILLTFCQTFRRYKVQLEDLTLNKAEFSFLSLQTVENEDHLMSATESNK